MDLNGETQTMTCKDRILNRAIGAIKLKQIDVIRVLMIHREIKTYLSSSQAIKRTRVVFLFIDNSNSQFGHRRIFNKYARDTNNQSQLIRD